MREREQAEQVLKTLGQQPGIKAVACITRDGRPGVNQFPFPVDEHMVSAMAAACLAAAETAVTELRTDDVRRIAIEAGEFTIILQGLDDELGLLVMADAGIDRSALEQAIDDACRSLQVTAR